MFLPTLFVCLLATFLKKSSTDFDEIFRIAVMQGAIDSIATPNVLTETRRR